MNIRDRFASVKICSFTCIVVLCISTAAWSGESMSKYDRARTLYREGPSKAPEIITLLKEELAVHPENDKAIRLLGITYFGIGESEKAIEQFDAFTLRVFASPRDGDEDYSDNVRQKIIRYGD